jgi:ubiquinone/menaquinone biosynthesis C-methylase UbiE
VSWYEVDPSLSLNLIQQVSPTPNSVIDVGGGQSLLVDRLLDIWIGKVAVLDISNVALDRTNERLGTTNLTTTVPMLAATLGKVPFSR